MDNKLKSIISDYIEQLKIIKNNRAKADEERWTDAEIEVADHQIRLIAGFILSLKSLLPEEEPEKKNVPVLKVYSGESVENTERMELHPVNAVKEAERTVDKFISYSLKKGYFQFSDYSNSPDYIMAIKYIAQKKGVPVEFFLNGVSHGDDIEPLFADFNKALDMIHEYCE